MRTGGVVLLEPSIEIGLELGDAEVELLAEGDVEGFVAHRSVEALTEPVGVGRMHACVGCSIWLTARKSS